MKLSIVLASLASACCSFLLVAYGGDVINRIAHRGAPVLADVSEPQALTNDGGSNSPVGEGVPPSDETRASGLSKSAEERIALTPAASPLPPYPGIEGRDVGNAGAKTVAYIEQREREAKQGSSREGGATRAETGPKTMCWKPRDLRGVPNDWKVVKGTERAYRLPPNRQPSVASALDPDLRGVIRSVQLPSDEKFISLTFDLCEQPYEVSGYDSRIIDYLRDQDVKATFFAGGKWLLTHDERAQQMLSDPLFEFGNHTWEHRNLRIVSDPVMKSEIENAQVAYEEVRGHYDGRKCTADGDKTDDGLRITAPQRLSLFRFPFGACDARSLNAVNDAGLLAIQWNISSGDPWPPQSADAMVKEVMPRVRPGSIILFHANGRGWHTAEALRELIPRLRQDGYKFLKVSELLKLDHAKIEKVTSCYDSKPGDSDKYDGLAARLEAQYQKFENQIRAQAGTSRDN